VKAGKSVKKRINARSVLVLMAAAAVIGVGFAVVNRIQIRLNAKGLADLARRKVDAGKGVEAIPLYRRYLAYRPNDAVAQAEFARLMLARSEEPNASNAIREETYNAVEAAVRKNPDDFPLRTRLAEWMMNARRFGDAGMELDLLLARVSAAEGDDPAAVPPAERDRLTLLRAQAHVGLGHYRQAAELLARICRFDLERGVPVAESDRGGGPQPDAESRQQVDFSAAILLTALLDEKLRTWTLAGLVLDHFVATHPDDFRGWLARANWHRSNGNVAAAAADLAKARGLAPEDSGALFTSFETAIALRRLVAAEQMILEARRLFPGDERVYRGMAALAVRRGELDRAADVLREGLAAKDLNDYVPLGQMLVDVLLQQGLVPEAEAALAAYVQRHGAGSPEAGLLEARLLVAQRRWLPARKKLESLRPLVAASAAMTNQVDIYLGQCHAQLGEFDQQLSANRRVLSEDHAATTARIGIAAAFATLGRQDEALEEYEALAAALSPDELAASPRVWYPLLQLRVAQQTRRPVAERDWSRRDALLDLLERSPEVSSTQLALLKSDACLREGDVAGAEQLLEDQLAAEPGSPQLTAALVALTLRTRGAAAAVRVAEEAAAEAVDTPLVMIAEAEAAARMPPVEAAARLAAIESRTERLADDEAAQVLMKIGEIRRNAGHLTEAERLWTAALDRRREDLQILVALQELACDLGEVERATATAEHIARLAGETSPQGRVATAAALVLAARQQADGIAEHERSGPPGPRRGAGGGGAATPAGKPDRITTAANLLVEAENERPGWVRIQRLFADIASLRGDAAQAIVRLERAMRLGAEDASSLRQLLPQLYRARRFDEARRTIDKLGPAGVAGLERLCAEIELNSGRIDEAVAFAERGRGAAAPDLLWFGQFLVRAGRPERAVPVLHEAVAADPRDPKGWRALVTAQFSVGRRRSVERTLDAAFAALDPPLRQMIMAEGCELLGRCEEAERHFRAAVAADRANAAALRGLASFLVRRGQMSAARDELRGILESSVAGPDGDELRVWTRRTLALLLAQGGGFRDVEEAVALLERNATDGTPSTEDLALTAGILADRPEPHNWRRAIGLFDAIGRWQPLSTAQRTQRVRLLERCGRWDDARDDLIAFASQPDAPPEVQPLLVERLIHHGERDTARMWLRTLTERSPEAPAVLELQARLALADNDRAAAAFAARKLLPDDIDDARLERLESAAATLESLGFTTAADEVFARYAAASTNGLLARAGFLGRQHRADEALDSLEAAWDRLPLLPLMQTAVQVLRDQGPQASVEQRDRVVAWLAKAGRQDPDAASLALLLADLRSLEGRDAEAVTIYRGLIGRRDLPPPEAAAVAHRLALRLAKPATAAEAERLLAAAVAEMGPTPEVLDARGCVLLAVGKTREAVAALEDAVLVPSPTKFLHLACALAADGQIKNAREALLKARTLGLDPRTLTVDDRTRLASLESTLGS